MASHSVLEKLSDSAELCAVSGQMATRDENVYATQRLTNVYGREILANLDVGVLIVDDAAVYLDVNQKACELFDRFESDIVGHHLSEFLPGARAEDVNLQWKAFLRDGSQSSAFYIHLRDGSFRELNFRARANFVEGLHCCFVTALQPGNASDQRSAITMCAWTKRIRVDDEWISIEEYLGRTYGLRVSHGISPDAFHCVDK